MSLVDVSIQERILWELDHNMFMIEKYGIHYLEYI